MATKREKSERRAWAKLQDRIEQMPNEHLQAKIQSLQGPGIDGFALDLIRVLREQIAVNNERVREDEEESIPDLPDNADA